MMDVSKALGVIGLMCAFLVEQQFTCRHCVVLLADLYFIPFIRQEALCEEEVAFDPKDPNRPRFTLQELRDVLHERNELKAKVFMLQEEIAYYKRSAILAYGCYI